MVKLLGAACVMAGALRCGFGAVGRLWGRLQTLEELHAALAWLEEELTFRLTPLPRLLVELGRTRKGAAGRFFQETLRRLQADPEGGVYQSWRQAMVQCLPDLQPEERQTLLEVGQTLGRFDAQTQRQALLRGRQRLAAFRDEARGEARRLGRVYAALSLTGGTAIILLLI